jgi:hypothetical protein
VEDREVAMKVSEQTVKSKIPSVMEIIIEEALSTGCAAIELETVEAAMKVPEPRQIFKPATESVTQMIPR